MDVVKIAKELVAIPSHETSKDVGGYIYRYLKELGFRPFKQPLKKHSGFNVICIGRGKLLINGHMDTVPIGERSQWKQNPYGKMQGARLYGRGSGDTKGNIAMLLAALTENPSEEITYTFSAIEEGHFEGIERIMELRKSKLRHIKYGITLEPMEGTIRTLSRGHYAFKVEARGKAAHSSRPELGENAIEKLVPCIERLQRYAKQLKKQTYKNAGYPTLSIGMVRGGVAINVVPDRAVLEVDRRVLPNEKPAQVIQKMKKICAPLHVQLTYRIEAAETPAQSRIVRFMQGIHSEKGWDTRLHVSRGTTELTGFRQHGIEGVIYGWGSIRVAHAPNEHITLHDLKNGKRAMDAVLEKVGIL